MWINNLYLTVPSLRIITPLEFFWLKLRNLLVAKLADAEHSDPEEETYWWISLWLLGRRPRYRYRHILIVSSVQDCKAGSSRVKVKVILLSYFWIYHKMMYQRTIIHIYTLNCFISNTSTECSSKYIYQWLTVYVW